MNAPEHNQPGRHRLPDAETHGSGPEAKVDAAADRVAAYEAYAELHDHDPVMLAGFEDSFQGGYERPELWADQLLRNYLADLPDWALNYVHVDARGLVSDLLANGMIHLEPRPEGGVWIFQIP